MKKIWIALLCITMVFHGEITVAGEETLYAKSAVLIDGENGRILYGKEPQTKMAMASTTKIMTCIIALENCTPDKIMSVSKRAAEMPKVHMNAVEGEQYYMKDLLYAMMLESYNDVAVVVAENTAGSVEAFASLMNQKAKEIGAKSTNFVTPNGLDDENHYSTAYDMALIGAYAVKNEAFVKIATTDSYSFCDVTGKRNISVSNRDAFLTMDSDAIGIKTGFTGNAGYCFVGAVKSGGRLFVSCVLACGWPPNKSYKWHDTRILMEIGKENYQYQMILEENYPLEVTVENGTKDRIAAHVDGKSKMLLSEKDDVELKTNIDYRLPLASGDTIGSVDIYVNQERAEHHEILAGEAVEKYDYRYCLKKLLRRFLLQ